MSLHSIADYDARLFSVRREKQKLLALGIDSVASPCDPLVTYRRNRCRVLSAIEFNLIIRRSILIAQLEEDQDPADQWKNSTNEEDH